MQTCVSTMFTDVRIDVCMHMVTKISLGMYQDLCVDMSVDMHLAFSTL